MTYLNHLKNASKIYLISGPSGVGKDTLINKLKSKSPNYFYPITATSRPKRHNETDGKHYIFLSEKKFQQLINTNEMLEWAKVYGHYYGVPLSQINEAISLDKVIVIKIDVQGVNTLKEIFPLSTSIFIAPALKSDLVERLKIRNSENDESIESRVNAAENELALSKNFDHIVINANNLIDTTVKKIQKIIQP